MPLVEHYGADQCRFTKNSNGWDDAFGKPSHYFVPGTEHTIRKTFNLNSDTSSENGQFVGVMAVKVDGVWKTEERLVILQTQNFHSRYQERPSTSWSMDSPCAERHFERYEYLAYPIHEDVRLEDINGAVEAEETDEGFVFHKVKVETHHNIKLVLAGAVQTLFSPSIQRAAQVVLTPSPTVANLATAIGKGNASEAYGLLLDLQDDVLKEVTDLHHGRHVGYYVDRPGSIHSTVKEAWDSVIEAWKGDKKKLERIAEHSAVVGKVGDRLDTHDYEHPWEQRSDDSASG